MTTELHDILELSFTAMNTFQTLWTIYVTVVLGILAYVAAAPQSNRSVLVRCLLVLGFSGFAYVNRDALSSVLRQRIELRQIALDKINALPEGSSEKESLKAIASPNKEDLSVQKMRDFHLAADLLVLAVIILLPSALIYLSPLRVTASRPKGEPSPLPPLSVTYDRSTRQWVTTADYVLDVSKLPNPPKGLDMDYTLRIPAGYAFDLATVPRLLWWLFAPHEFGLVPPLIHDFIYDFEAVGFAKGAVTKSDGSQVTTIDQERADLLLNYLFSLESVGGWRQILAINAVHIFGGVLWTRHARRRPGETAPSPESTPSNSGTRKENGS